MRPRKKILYTSLAGALVLLATVLASVLLLGTAESVSSVGAPSAGAPPSAAAPSTATMPAGTTAATRGLPSASLHDRVMAEATRAIGARPSDPQYTATTQAEPATGVEAASVVETAEAVEPTTAKGPTSVILTDGQTPLRGLWSGSTEQLAAYLLGVCPEPRFTVSTSALAQYYVHYCAEAGLRADLLWAQMLNETGYGQYGGDVVPEQNNFAGIGATGGGRPGAYFETAEAGVLAHVTHMVAYVYTSSPVSWANTVTDPRFDFVDPRGEAAVLSDLNGRWAVPGTYYGQNIEAIARAINGG